MALLSRVVGVALPRHVRQLRTRGSSLSARRTDEDGSAQCSFTEQDNAPPALVFPINKQQRSQLRSHLLRIAAYVAAFFWLAFVWGAIKVLSVPDTGKHSHLAGWAILVIAAGVMFATMNHWVRYLQLVLGAFILGCLFATIQGHLLNGATFPRSIAAAMTALLIGCSLISRTLAERKLRRLDRAALIAFLGALIGGAIPGTPISGLVGLAIGFGCFLVTWLYDRSLSGKHRRRENGNGDAVVSVRG